MGAKLIQVIETDLEKRGNGKDVPVRIVQQFWSPEGDLIVEDDPWMRREAIPELIETAREVGRLSRLQSDGVMKRIGKELNFALCELAERVARIDRDRDCK